MDYHPVVSKIIDLLTKEGVWFETFEHEPVRTSEEAAKVRTGYTIQQGAKAIIARVKEPEKGKRFVQFIIPGSAKFDTKKIKEQFALGDIRFALEHEVNEITGGVLPGGVPPFGNLFALDVFVDENVLKNEKIIFNAGDKRFSVGMLAADYASIVPMRIGRFIQDA